MVSTLCSCSVPASLVKEMPLRQGRERVCMQYCHMGSQGEAVPEAAASTPPFPLALRHEPWYILQVCLPAKTYLSRFPDTDLAFHRSCHLHSQRAEFCI